MLGRKVGRFLVLAKLGQGGMATVWRARDELLGRDVALKILDPKLADSLKVRRRFVHEARTVANLDHPGAVAVYDSGESEGNVYIAMRWVDGETLSKILARRLLPLAEAVRIVIAVAEVLAHAHQRGVIHRDVTSRNVMIGADGRVFVLDFGLALATWESRVTSSGATLGTVPYMAPEVLLGREADARTDLYGLGVVLYEALTGAYPHRGDLPAVSAFAALHGDPLPPRERRPEIGDDLERLVLKSIEREPEARFQSAAEMIAALRAADSAESGASPPAETGRSRPSSSPRPTTFRRPDPLYLAILQFQVRGPVDAASQGVNGFGARLRDALVAGLLSNAGVHVVPSPADLEPRDDLLLLAREVGANAVLHGSIDRTGTQLRVSYWIHDPWRGRPWAAEILEGSILQVFDLEERVVKSLVRVLGPEAPPTSPAPASRPRDPAARERFQQALGYLKRYDNEASVDGAIRVLEGLIASEGDTAAYEAALARAFIHKLELTGQRMWEGRAATACERARTADPDSPDVHLALGELYHVSGREEDSVREFERAASLQPELVEPWIGLIRAHDHAGRTPAAEEAARQGLLHGGRDWRVHSHVGTFYFRRARFERALEHWRRVLELAPDNARGRFNVGSALYRLDRFEEAVEAYRASIEIVPNPVAYTNLGTVLYYLGRHEESVGAFQKATELSPLEPIYWGNLGNAYRWIAGRQQDSVDALQQAVSIMREKLDRNPNDADGWARLAGWLANRDQHAQALEAIDRALALAPDDPPCLVRAGHVYFQLDMRDSALRSFERAVRRGYGVGELDRSIELAPLRQDPEFRRILGQSSNPTTSRMSND